MKDLLLVLEEIVNIYDGPSKATSKFLKDIQATQLPLRYLQCLAKSNVDLGFNAFAIVSDFYYRETFHSDILKVLIDPSGGHQEQAKFLHLFLRYLQLQGAKVEPSNYTDTEVTKEEAKIDILIKDRRSMRAIIIENKINNAGDMDRQIPRYLNLVTALGYKCDAVVYLRLNGFADPDTTGWTDSERDQVRTLLQVVCAYDDTENDLLNGWILKCEMAATNADARHILRHYGQLIQKLGGKAMNKMVMEQFYGLMRAGENHRTALALQPMLSDLTPYRKDRILEQFRHCSTPFHRTWSSGDNTAVFSDCFHKNAHFKVDIVVEPEGYIFVFWDQDDENPEQSRAKQMLQQLNCLSNFSLGERGFVKWYNFPSQEEELHKDIASFFRALNDQIQTKEDQ